MFLRVALAYFKGCYGLKIPGKGRNEDEKECIETYRREYQSRHIDNVEEALKDLEEVDAAHTR